MKKVFALFLVLAMLCSFAACGSKNTNNGGNPAIVAYMKKNGDKLLAEMEESFAGSSGMTCKSSWEVDGNDLILYIRINEMDNLETEEKDAFQQVFDSMDDQFELAQEGVQMEIPEVESLILKVCEKDGDIIAVID